MILYYDDQKLENYITKTQRPRPPRPGSKVQFPHDDQRDVFGVARRRVKYQNAPVWLVGFSDVMGYSIGDLAVVNIDRLFIRIE